MLQARPNARLFPAMLLLVVVMSMVVPQVASAAKNFGQPNAGQHIYDKAEVLTPEQIGMLEQHAQQVVNAGAPVIVYLQTDNASYDETEQDARDLMDQWDVQSAPDARDGLVIFFNLKPNDRHHGQAALFAGQKHYDGGNLPDRELQRIFDKVMKPYLANGDLAGGIAAGLDAAANSLRNGPPPPPPPTAAQRFTSDISDGPLSIVSLVSVALTAAFAWLALRVWRTKPTAFAPIAATTSPPDSTRPAIVGAVVTGRVRDEQIEATILELAHRGALVIESGSGKNEAQVRLIDPSIPNNDVEHKLWDALEIHADSDGVVTKSNLAATRSSWSDAREALKKELEDRGLFDPRAKYRRRPVYLASIGLFVASAAAFVVGIIGLEPWAFVASGLLVIVAVVGVIWMSFYPDTTRSGAELAATWRSYIEGIKRSKSDPTLDTNLDLDEVMPYAVASGVTSSISKRLKSAAEEGYVPVWLGPSSYRNGTVGNAYLWWTGFHSAVTPTSSGGASGGGASAGGGGAGGSF